MPDAILIAEDDPVYRSFIKDAIGASRLRDAPLFEAANGEAAVELARHHHTSQVILDLQMPLLSGVDAARLIWASDPQARILFWSNFADEAYVRSIARNVPSGASYGYLLKSTSAERLMVAIEGVFLAGQCIIDREILGIQARAESWPDTLNNAEYDMLIDISLGFTDQAIALRHGISTRGVQGRLQRLYAKLGVNTPLPGEDADPSSMFNPRTRAICLAVLRGLINIDVIARAGSQTDTV